MRFVASKITRTRVSVVRVSTVETKYWTHGIPYKLYLLDRTKIRRFERFAVTFFWNIQIRSNP